MRRGRKPAKYAEEFKKLVLNRREFFGYSLVALAKISGVNRGALSDFFNGGRNGFGYHDRLKLICALNLGPEAENRFLDEKHRRALKSPLILLDPPTSPHPPLEQGQRFLICANYPDAIREFEIVYRVAGEQHDYPLQADAAARIAWAWFEQGSYRRSMDWVRTGIDLIGKHTGATFGQIMDSIQPGSQSSLCPLNEETSHVLSRLLQIRYKLYIESVLYLQNGIYRDQAMKSVEQSIILDRHLQLPAAIGHDLRWQSVLIISADEPQKVVAESLLDESRELFGDDSLGAAYLARDRGIFNWQTERYARSNNALSEAVDKLASYADSRALGPTFHVLSNVVPEVGTDARTARRFALAGAVLHPYGFVLENAVRHISMGTHQGAARDIDDLLSGAKPFEKLAPVLSRLTDGSSSATSARLNDNLTRILGQDVHSWLRGSAVQPRSL